MPTTNSSSGSVYDLLGVGPVINARGNNTVLGGSTPSARVRRAMEEAEHTYVDMAQLLDRAGKVIAELLGAEAAYVTPGASAAMALGAAACMTGADPDKIGRIPDTSGMPNSILIQAAQRYHYQRALTVPGAQLVAVGDETGTTAAQLEAALGPNVAAVFYPAHLEGTPGTLGLDEVCTIAHTHNTPVLVDAAGRVYPLDKFKNYAGGKADLVAFGAKYLGALNASGILCGRKDLVEAAALHGFIGFETLAWEKSFGRPLKLDRQTIVAVVTALQEWLETDHDARLASYERRLDSMRSELDGAAGVALSIVHSDGPSPRVLRLAIDPSQARLTAREVVDGLWNGTPAIAVISEGDAVIVNPVTLREEDDGIVASRLGMLLL